MKNLKICILTVLAAGMALFASSCHMGCISGSGTSSTENRKSGNFTKVDIEGSFKVTFKQDSSATVIVTADDNLQKYIHTTVDGDRLRIYSRKNLCSKSPMNVTVGVKNLSLLRGSGAVEVNNDGKLNVGDIKIDLSGACKANLDINAANVITTGSGATEVHLKGQATSNKVDINGNGHLYAFDFVTGDYNIQTTGAAELEINVLRTLKINTTGASKIKYKGNPSSIQNDKAGASELKKVD